MGGAILSRGDVRVGDRMAKAKVALHEGAADVQPAKMKKHSLPPVDRSPRCELCLHYYRHDLKKKRRREPQSCHDLNCEPHDHCKLFQRLAEPLTQAQVVALQRMGASPLDVLEALIIDRRKQLKDYAKRRIRELLKAGKVWVRWRDPESGKVLAARALRVSAAAVMLKPRTDGVVVPEKIKVLDVLEFLTHEEYRAQKEHTIREIDPPTTRRPRTKSNPKK